MSIQISTPFPLVLGSGSPRRRQLLADAGYTFTVVPADIDETVPFDVFAHEAPAYLSRKKAEALAHLAQDHIVLTADTVVILNNSLINKPDSLREAEEMLRNLSARQHTVVSGVTLLFRGQSVTFKETTLVYFRALTDQEIKSYVEHFRPLDKAGAYGVQEWIGLVGVTRIEGDFYNVMGLPVCRLKTELDKLALKLAQS